jgi:hypothetical protein
MKRIDNANSEFPGRLNFVFEIIAGAPQIFHKNFFFFFIRKTSPGSEKNNFILKNLPGICNSIIRIINRANLG